jgi:flagellar hook-basal body complex protein FliE
MSEINMNSVLAQMRAMAAQAQGLRETSTAPVQGTSFAGVMRNAIDHVNATQKDAAALGEAFERGNKEIDPVEVMVSLQKAKVSFQAVTQVRNKLVSAYQEIMNMPV